LKKRSGSGLYPNRDNNGVAMVDVFGGYRLKRARVGANTSARLIGMELQRVILVEVGGIEPHARVAAQGLTLHCDQIVTVFRDPSQVSSRYWLIKDGLNVSTIGIPALGTSRAGPEFIRDRYPLH